MVESEKIKELEEKLELCLEFIKDCANNHVEPRFRYRAIVITKQLCKNQEDESTDRSN